jgi:histidyl-tRNA synthetase
MAKLAAPSGFRDFLPADFRRRQELVRRIRETYERFGFEGMDTPAMESVRTFVGKGGGDNEKLMFHVLKRGADLERARAAGGVDLSDLALRFDLTVPLARFYATHRGALPAVFKRYQIGPVWRAERAQHGRFREFVQCDVDVLGSPSMAVEADVVLATTTALAALGFQALTVRLNSRPLLRRLVSSAGVPESHLDAAIIGVDKLDKETPAAVAEELGAKGVPPAAAQALMALHAKLTASDESRRLADVERRVGAPGAAEVARLREIIATTPPLPSGRLVFDPFLARGMDYYTGPIFEVWSADAPWSLAGGGRYDELVERLAGVAVPACGFSIGFERVYTLMEERGLFTDAGRAADVLLAIAAADAAAEAAKLGVTLRDGGVRADVFPHSTKLGTQFELAEKKGIPFAIVVDVAKIQSGTAEVRDLRARKSTPVAVRDLAAWLRDRLAGG